MKIAIIGPNGAGKTTLARKLGPSLKIKHVFHLDRFFLQPDWQKKPVDDRIDILQALVQEKQWIIEGPYLNLSELYLKEADVIIFLEISPLVCLWRRFKRDIANRGRSRCDIPGIVKLTFLILLQVLAFQLLVRGKFEDKLRKFPSEKVIRLHSTKEVDSFLHNLQCKQMKRCDLYLPL